MRRLATSPRLDGERYGLEDEVGQGGMGVVFRIHDRYLNRRMAMKVLADRGEARDEEERQLQRQFLGRFLEEAQVTSQLDHPGVVPVHELGLDNDGRVFFTMRLVKGSTASEVFAAAHAGSGGWTLSRALDVLLKVCDTVAYAHDKGVLHRDLKPSNLMVGRFGEVYVMDWGLAKVVGQDDSRDVRIRPREAGAPSVVDSVRKQDSASGSASSVVSMDGQRLGTPSYMSPEQARGEDLDHRADVYAIGAMLYELVTGRAPFTTPGLRRRPYDILADVVEGRPKAIEEIRKDVPAELVAIVNKAMSRERDQRYPSTLALAADIRAFLDHRVVDAYETGALAELRLWIRRNRPLALALAASILILIAGIAASAVYAQRATRNETIANQRADENERLAEEKSQLARSEGTAREALARKIGEFDQLAGIVKYKRAVAREAQLYPAWPERAEELERWLVEECAPLLQMAPAAKEALASLRKLALPLTAEERQRDFETHPRSAEWRKLQQRLTSLRRAQSIRDGSATPEAVELPAERLDSSPGDLNRFVWDRVARTDQRRIWGQEAIALVAARRAVETSQGAPDAHKHLDALSLALFVNGLDDEARTTSDAAVAAAPEDARKTYERYRVELLQAIESAPQTLAEAESSSVELEGLLRERRTWNFPKERAAEDFLHEALRQLLVQFNALEHGSKVSVERRLRWAREIEALTLAHPNATVTWGQVASELQSNPRYAADPPVLDPQRLLGLVPLGMNPVTGLFEFYHLRSAWDGESDPAGIPIPVLQADGQIARGNAAGMVFVLLPGATCMLGAQSKDPDGPNYDPLAEAIEVPHRVTLAPFLIARYEMTQGQWARLSSGSDDEPWPSNLQVGGNNFIGGTVTEEHPVDQVDWSMCDRLLTRHGLLLPTEAQWEYACRGGTDTPWPIDGATIATYANLADETARRSAPQWAQFEVWNDGHVVTAPVGSFRSNPFGLYDMAGNIREWCRDTHGLYGTERLHDGLRTDSGSRDRNLRGGCYMDIALSGRSAKRGAYDAANRDGTTGVRAVRALDR